MAAQDQIQQPLRQELAPTEDSVLLAAGAFLGSLRQNPDTVLTARGPTLEVYRELLRDDQVRACFQQRRTALVQAEWKVDPASDAPEDVAAAEFVTEMMHRVGIDDKTDKMAYALFYGWGVAECLWEVEDNRIVLSDLRVRDRERFGFNYRNELLLITKTAPAGVLMPPKKFWWINAGAADDENPYGLGLAHSVYWPVFFKRNGIKFWSIFLEKFGMPTALAKLPAGQVDQPAERAKALAALRAIQVDSGIVVPDTVVIELLEAARSGTADYDALCERMNSAIAKTILSQTMTTDNGSSLSQAQVHSGVAQAVIKSDADLICDSLNRTVIRWLTEFNFPSARPPRLWRCTEPPADLNARAERDTKIATLGYEPTEQYIEETYGAGWQKKETPAVPPVPTGPLGPEFAEISALAKQRVDHRADQAELLNAASYLSTKYRDLYGKRVEQLLTYLDETQDFATFKARITEMMAESAPAQAVETVQRANVISRLMGRLRRQR